jgi:hypothetical protein
MNDREYVLCALSVATRAIENAATALHKQEAREFGDTAQTKGSPKLPSNSAWKLVPVEPTPEMLDAMQTAGIAAFDADIDASLGDTPLDPTHARRAIWRAALDAAPEVPSAEPVAWRISGRFGWTYQEEPPYATQHGRTAEPLYATPQPDHREVMFRALEALEYHTEQTRPIERTSVAIQALRAALGERE